MESLRSARAHTHTLSLTRWSVLKLDSDHKQVPMAGIPSGYVHHHFTAPTHVLSSCDHSDQLRRKFRQLRSVDASSLVSVSASAISSLCSAIDASVG